MTMRDLIQPDDDYLGLESKPNPLMMPEEAEIRPHPLIRAGELLDGLSENQERFLVAKLYGMTDAAAARAIGLSSNMGSQWKGKYPDFKKVYELVTEQPVVMAAEVTAFGLTKAINQLVKMLDHPSAQVQMYAIDKLIAIGGLNKNRIEVTKKNDGPSDDDIDAALDRIERRKSERDGDGDRDNEV